MLSKSAISARSRLARYPPRLRRRKVPLPQHHPPLVADGALSDATYQSQILNPCQQRAFPVNDAPPKRGSLASVLGALQRQNLTQLADAFIAWTALMEDESQLGHRSAIEEARALRATTVSEIVRSLDPILNPGVDEARGVAITKMHMQLSPLHALVDEFGIRNQHVRVLMGMYILKRARHDVPFCISDYETMIRCAGSAGSLLAAKHFFRESAYRGRAGWRTPRTWKEFIKARFLTEPTYYQYDLSRIAFRPRDLHRIYTPLPTDVVKVLDRMEYSANILSPLPWNRVPGQPDGDVRRQLRKRVGYKSYMAHWRRARAFGIPMDEEFLSTSMIAFARSGSQYAIKTLILRDFYDIECVERHPSYSVEVSGGRDLSARSMVRPTGRLLDAIADAFGSMGKIEASVKIIQLMATKYNVLIPASTWSKILHWAYHYSTGPAAFAHKLQTVMPQPLVTAEVVLWVWRTMTSDAYGVEPSFDDWYVYARVLAKTNALRGATDALRQHMVPEFRRLDAEYRAAVLDELMVNDTHAFPADASHARRRAEARKDHARFCIARCLHLMLRASSLDRVHRRGYVARAVLPALVEEFGEFLPREVQYRTAQGRVAFERPGVIRRHDRAEGWRSTVPIKLAYHMLTPDDGFPGGDEPVDGLLAVPEKDWPDAEQLRILDRQRRPKSRTTFLGRPPLPPARLPIDERTDPRAVTSRDYKLKHSGIEWFRMLERELLL
ncbi:hypothetical protein HIM_08552 [Hirsutella minnesotensis 3608]|uniref:Mitochondrial ATPase expression-domain-containing protein n=1 Tax=Hirsutella minnesotensis 3608 TaxID=1043627 RepID=A0A0F7ZY98_9HYPO|nr:hypothetical protein HIM_08552 [Hirsutella minnesotensis 3608]